jgi:hypothetical protein
MTAAEGSGSKQKQQLPSPARLTCSRTLQQEEEEAVKW